MRSKLLVLAIFVATPFLSAQTQREVPARAVERIQKEVRHEILMLPYFDVFDDIKYSVAGYEVTLTGQVTNPTLRRDAENVVKHIEGVEKVVNQIEVLPTSSMGCACSSITPFMVFRRWKSTPCLSSNPSGLS
jgi:hyperosmotically inducible protein